jgi:hypothetical protein
MHPSELSKGERIIRPLKLADPPTEAVWISGVVIGEESTAEGEGSIAAGLPDCIIDATNELSDIDELILSLFLFVKQYSLRL